MTPAHPYYIPDRDRPGVGHTDTTAMRIAHDEMRRMLALITDRLEQAITYKGDETSEWAYKEADKVAVIQARETLKLVMRLEGGM